MNYQNEIKIIKSIVNKTIQNNNKILVCGNGGSASDSNHIVAEFVGKFERKRPPYNALSLTSNVALLTAIGNDFGFEHIFSRQIEAVGNEKDLLIAISTSGTSPNIISSIDVAIDKGLEVIFISGNKIKSIKNDLTHIRIDSNITSTVQESYMFILHNVVRLIENE
tara:strand:- start:4378 stop:4875 length:498 start_codon:yes stop_codon:yes gene_type:complete